MPITSINFERISEADLQSLQENEGIVLDYKRALYGTSDADKREFLKDVSSFANTAGGHIVIGIEEEGGLPTKVTGVDGDLDAEMQRLGNLMHDRMEPRIIGTRMRPIPLDNGRRALVIRIPKSWNPPHAVIHNKSRLIYARNPAGVHEASVDEMRSMFTAGATLLERSREFQRQRMEEIHSGEGPGPSPFKGEGGRMVLHIIPFSAFGSDMLDLGFVHEQILPPVWCTGNKESGYNVDGYYTTDSTVSRFGYVQVFRNGIVESAAGDVREKWGDRLVVQAVIIENEMVAKIEQYMAVLSRAEVSPPMFVMLGGVRMHGTTIVVGDTRPTRPLRKSNWVLPAITLEDYGQKADYGRALKPMFDAIWNAAGEKGSTSYGPDGNWNRTG
jgi:Putative DNA-binding domain